MTSTTNHLGATSPEPDAAPSVAVVGAGPSGLMVAEVLSQAGVAVEVYDAMPSAGRKFLLAGLGGLNLTHAEPFDAFVQRYGRQADVVSSWLQNFDADALRSWALGLGIETFVGSSQRVFPRDMKAAPLLRAWLHRLRHPDQGRPVRFHMRHRWLGWDQAMGNSTRPTGQATQTLRFAGPDGPVHARHLALVLALGGGSWSRLGSDGAWVPLLAERGVDIAPLLPSNCGFEVRSGWSPFLRERFAGSPLKSVALEVPNSRGGVWRQKGECVLTEYGLEGSLVYAASSLLRDAIGRDGEVGIALDLLPDWSAQRVAQEVAHPRGSRSLGSHLRSRMPLDAAKLALINECLTAQERADVAMLARSIKALPVQLVRPRPLDEAISSAGGIRHAAMDEHLMLRAVPGVFCAGEMLDWDAPTGGYLLSACMASARHAGLGVLRWLASQAAGTPGD